MILGFFSGLANFLLDLLRPLVDALIPVVADVFEAIAEAILPHIIPIIALLFKKLNFNHLLVIFIDALIMFLELIVTICFGGKDKLVAWIITQIFSTYDFITNPSRLECLSWTPINYIFSGADNVPVGSLTNPYYLSLKLMHEGIKPTAMIVFALIIMVELFQITIRTEGMRNSGFESPFKLMLKVAVCKILLDNTEFILRSIFEVGTDMVLRLNLVASSIDITPTEDTLKTLTDGLLAIRPLILFLMLLQSYLQCGLVWLIMKTFLPLIVLSRMIEIYMMIVLAPIPFATFAHQEFSSVGKSYLKQFIGVSFKAAVMFIIVIIYGSLMTIATIDITNVEVLYWAFTIIKTLIGYGLWIPALVVFLIFFGIKPLIFSFMLLSALQGADSYTRKITGAWY